MALSKEAVLKHAGGSINNTREVHVPAWRDETGDDVMVVRGMTIKEFEIHQARIARAGDDDRKLGKANAWLIARCSVEPRFTDADVDQIAELGLGEVLRLSSAISDLSGLNQSGEAEARGESETQTSSGSSE